MKSGQFFTVKNSFDGFKKGNILLLGDSETMEFFDITTEILTGHSYSSYNVKETNIEIVNNKKQIELSNILKNFIESDYKITDKMITYFEKD
jgi:hypothetical protein